MKIYISQPTADKSELQILRERTVVEQKLKLSHPDAEFSYRSIRYKVKGLLSLEESIKLLHDADMVYFLDNWSWDTTCMVESYCCRVFRIPNDIMRTYTVSESLNHALLTYKRNTGHAPFGIRMSEKAFKYLKIECKPFLGELVENTHNVTFEGVPVLVEKNMYDGFNIVEEVCDS